MIGFSDFCYISDFFQKTSAFALCNECLWLHLPVIASMNGHHICITLQSPNKKIWNMVAILAIPPLSHVNNSGRCYLGEMVSGIELTGVRSLPQSCSPSCIT